MNPDTGDERMFTSIRHALDLRETIAQLGRIRLGVKPHTAWVEQP